MENSQDPGRAALSRLQAEEMEMEEVENVNTIGRVTQGVNIQAEPKEGSESKTLLGGYPRLQEVGKQQIWLQILSSCVCVCVCMLCVCMLCVCLHVCVCVFCVCMFACVGVHVCVYD